MTPAGLSEWDFDVWSMAAPGRDVSDGMHCMPYVGRGARSVEPLSQLFIAGAWNCQVIVEVQTAPPLRLGSDPPTRQAVCPARASHYTALSEEG